MQLDQLDFTHRFYHDKASELTIWFEECKNKPHFGKPEPPFKQQALHLVERLKQWDEESKAVRWETIRWAISEYTYLFPVNALWRDDRFDPSNKDSAWVQDVAFEQDGQLIILVRYLDDYTFRQPYWCTQFIALR